MTQEKKQNEVAKTTSQNPVATADAKQKVSLSLIKASLNKDWSKVPEDTRYLFVQHLCHQLNIAPVLNPFRFIKINGVEILYADKRTAALIGNANKISTEILKESYDSAKQILKIYVRASQPDGRFSDEYAALHLGANVGETRANLEMKCLTKAKRRGILAMVDMSIPDEEDLKYLESAGLASITTGASEQQTSGGKVIEPATPADELESARILLMETLTENKSGQMEFMKKFIADNTQGMKLHELDYDQCHELIAKFEAIREAGKKVGQAIKSAIDGEQMPLVEKTELPSQESL